MYVHRIIAENFRTFGDKKSDKHLDLTLNKTLNVIVGENDAGKTAIVDAIRYALLTTSFEFIRLEDDDFHVEGPLRADQLSIEVELRDLSLSQQAALVEWLTHDGGETFLVVHMRARRNTTSSSRTRVEVRFHSGADGSGPEIGGAVRDLVRATYLKPLRDAEAELSPGRQSRLSQILKSHKDIQKHAKSDYVSATPAVLPTTLVGFMDQAQFHIGESAVIKSVQTNVNDNYLKHLSFSGSLLSASIGVAAELSLQHILERLELVLRPPNGVAPHLQCSRGLGYNNVLFMATELLLLGVGDELALLLIEEPEAHLHPQLQARVVELLERQAKDAKQPIQVVVTTHSPNLASAAPVDSVILVVRGKPYRLCAAETSLEAADYRFLRRFLDVTKANLFFARGVVIVEGKAEALLLPAIAEACGCSFTAAGISVVEVGTVGLFRYARILQRKDGVVLPIPVACVTDRDIVPDHISYVASKKGKKRKAADFTVKEADEHVQRRRERAGGGSTKVFVSDTWTLEYDLASSEMAQMMFDALYLANHTKNGDVALCETDLANVLFTADAAWDAKVAATTDLNSLAGDLFEPLHSGSVSKPIVAQFAAELVRSGRYGSGATLRAKLPQYLQDMLAHVTPSAP
jgi:putative ATP-dependent endonuclease of OLD family